MSHLNVLVTGSSRGLGLEFVKQLSAAGHHVLATARAPQTSELARVGNGVELFTLDVASEASIAALKETLGTRPIDILINNAGVSGDTRSAHGRQGFNLEDPGLTQLVETFITNAAGPFLLTRALLPNLLAGKTRKVVHISSGMGSIGQGAGGGYYPYRMAKAALNMMGANMASETGSRGLITLLLNPGWVRTDMGGAGAPLDVKDSIRDMLKVIHGATARDNGKFLDLDGSELPW
jgi:NAD(P)-dependent dehydrogenase (short-subunit alcohol dehydrogenase family)